MEDEESWDADEHSAEALVAEALSADPSPSLNEVLSTEQALDQRHSIAQTSAHRQHVRLQKPAGHISAALLAGHSSTPKARHR